MASCRWGKNWQLAPSVIAQHSEDRYRDGDRYDWATFNLRVSQGDLRSLRPAACEASWQYMDLNPNGRSYRYNDNVYQYQAVRGDFYKLTFAPTFKVGDVLDIKARPEIRFFATWMNWDKALDRYAINDDFGSKALPPAGHGTSACRRRFGFNQTARPAQMPGRVDLNTRCYFVTMPVLYEVI